MTQQLTLTQRAKRATTKFNNRLRKSMPLFADLLTDQGEMADWLTTPVQQERRLLGMKEIFEKYWSRLEDAEKEFKKRGDNRRAIVARHVDAATMAGLDEYYARILAGYGPEYWADYWWGVLVKYVPKKAQKLCPNGHMHEEFSRWHKCCPTCGKELPPAPAPASQLALAL